MLGEQGSPSRVPFPILSLCIDSESRWLALLTTDHVALWNLVDHVWAPAIEIETQRHKPEAFFFGYEEQSTIPPVVLVQRNGTLTELRPDSKGMSSLNITEGRVLVSASSLAGTGEQSPWSYCYLG